MGDFEALVVATLVSMEIGKYRLRFFEIGWGFQSMFGDGRQCGAWEGFSHTRGALGEVCFDAVMMKFVEFLLCGFSVEDPFSIVYIWTGSVHTIHHDSVVTGLILNVL